MVLRYRFGAAATGADRSLDGFSKGVRFGAPPARTVILGCCRGPAAPPRTSRSGGTLRLWNRPAALCYRVSARIGQQRRCLLALEVRLDRLVQVVEHAPTLLRAAGDHRP